MKKATSADVRGKFIEFFREKSHTAIPSASLLPDNDPSVLFTTAGMHPLVPYLLGEIHPGGKRLVSVQKCIRTGDIDEVGDNRHLTFFEMLGNWSLGDYFKQEAIAWSFEFLTSHKWLGLDPGRLYVSVFEGDNDAPKDDEAIQNWKTAFATVDITAEVGDWEEGIKRNDRIFLYGKDKNWWGPAGETGPCGPDTEMFYDTLNLKDKSAHATYWKGSGYCHPNCDCGRYVEIWNDVFMQYQKTKTGTFEPLAQKNVDTGMGLERTVSVMNGEDVFLIDTFAELIKKIEELSEKKYGESETVSRSMRVIADHLRSAVFIVGDEHGVAPSNVGQGYVLRRLIRRAVRHAKLLGIQTAFTAAISGEVVNIFGSVYPELAHNRSKILSELEAEEKKFADTLERGLREFARLTEVDGKIAFDLYQSYGFPLELTEELSRERGFHIERSVFEAEFKKHQDLSRTASAGQFKGGLADASDAVVRLHTATHLLHQALIDVLGGTADQKGSNITAERLRFDFAFPRKVTPEEIKRVEEIVNQRIKEKLPVHFELLSVEEAKKRGALGVFEEKYTTLGDKVKVYFVGDYSKEICGGPHVENTGTIGSFKIQKEEAISAGVRRIRAVVVNE